jgi:ankyrin repeat protein
MHRTLEADLLAAAASGDTITVRRLLEAGADVHGYDRDDYAPLRGAIAGHHVDCVQLLLESGACIRRADWDAFEQARALGDDEIAALIREVKIGVDFFCQLVRSGERQDVLDWLERDPHVVGRIDNVHGPVWTPLMHAASTGGAELVRLFLAAGANPHSTYDASSMNALTIALYYEHDEVARLLGAYGVQSDGVTNCMYAAAEGNLAKVHAYLERCNVDVNARDACGHGIFRHAYYSGNQALVSYLVEQGADVNEMNGRDGSIWIQGLIQRGEWERTRFILDLGYDVNHTDARGNTCLKYAREAGRPEVESLLVAYGATQ